jgi:hypothetical protein
LKNATVSLKNTPSEDILFHMNEKKMKELEQIALDIARSSNVPIKLSVGFNPEKTRCSIKIMLIPKVERL